jgi:nucleotide-binding universal stress UspA family protein
MRNGEPPVVVAYDGSDAAVEAVRVAAELFAGHRIVVVTVWEPGLAMALAAGRDLTGSYSAMLPSADEIVAVDRAQHNHAAEAAEQGARLAADAGVTAEACSLSDETGVASTIAAFAARCDACALVVGSRGLGGVRSRLFGSTSRALLERATRPVLIVRAAS